MIDDIGAARGGPSEGGGRILQTIGVRKKYPGVLALDAVDFDLRPGEVHILFGENGAGKSTLISILAGVQRPSAGEVRFRGERVELQSVHHARDLGISAVFQEFSLVPQMTVEENLLMGGFLLDSRARAKQAAERVFDRYPRLAARRGHAASVLSGGERRLLEISRALVMEPEVLLVDEPSIGLEPRFIDMVFEILRELQQDEGKTIVMVEQNAKKGLQFADLGYVLVSGELAMAGTGDELLANSDVGRLFLGG